MAIGQDTPVAECVFCGGTSKPTKEHVWAQWLRKYPAFSDLVETEGSLGERFRLDEPKLQLDDEGDRFQEVVVNTHHVAKLLPHVTVPVCGPCNKGWMSNLEDVAKSVLHPMILGDQVIVSRHQQAQLAAWVTKMAYAYTSTSDPSNDPFSTTERRELMTTLQAPERVHIWMGHSTSPLAYIALRVDPLYLLPPDTPAKDLAWLPPEGASIYVATHSVVFICHWLPKPLAAIYDTLPWRKTMIRGLRPIWPSEGEIHWPLTDVPESVLAQQRDLLRDVHEATAVATANDATLAELDSAHADDLGLLFWRLASIPTLIVAKGLGWYRRRLKRWETTHGL